VNFDSDAPKLVQKTSPRPEHLLLLLEISVRLLTKIAHEQVHSTLPTSKTNGRHGQKVHFPHLCEPFPRITHPSWDKKLHVIKVEVFFAGLSAKGRAEFLGQKGSESQTCFAPRTSSSHKPSTAHRMNRSDLEKLIRESERDEHYPA
jgi:hypothetical protein